MCKANNRSLTVAARFEAPLLKYPLGALSDRVARSDTSQCRAVVRTETRRWFTLLSVQETRPITRLDASGADPPRTCNVGYVRSRT